MNDRDKLHIHHILESIDRITDYTQSDKNIFVQDRKTYDAVLRNLQTLSESTQKLSDTFKAEYPAVEWQKIAGFRNILVHDYLGDLNTDLVWEIIEHKLPELKAQLSACLN